MYLVSLYFDETADLRIRQLIRQTAEMSGNDYMLEGSVPPHITLSAFESKCEEEVIECLDMLAEKFRRGDILWVSTGQFFPGVLFLTVVLNEYLHELSAEIYNGIKEIPYTSVSRYYRPFQWLPHTTIAKKLSREEMQKAFSVLQNQFGVFAGSAVRLGLSKTNPYRDIKLWELK